MSTNDQETGAEPETVGHLPPRGLYPAGLYFVLMCWHPDARADEAEHRCPPGSDVHEYSAGVILSLDAADPDVVWVQHYDADEGEWCSGPERLERNGWEGWHFYATLGDALWALDNAKTCRQRVAEKAEKAVALQ